MKAAQWWHWVRDCTVIFMVSQHQALQVSKIILQRWSWNGSPLSHNTEEERDYMVTVKVYQDIALWMGSYSQEMVFKWHATEWWHWERLQWSLLRSPSTELIKALQLHLRHSVEIACSWVIALVKGLCMVIVHVFWGKEIRVLSWLWVWKWQTTQWWDWKRDYMIFLKISWEKTESVEFYFRGDLERSCSLVATLGMRLQTLIVQAFQHTALQFMRVTLHICVSKWQHTKWWHAGRGYTVIVEVSWDGGKQSSTLDIVLKWNTAQW